MQFEFGEFHFDGVARTLTRRGDAVHLAPKAFDLLEVLIEERPRALRKQELQDRLWPDVVVEQANLKNLVGEIRAALGAGEWIRTVHRYGYAFASAPAPEESVLARLVVEGRVHRLRPGENMIGRAEECGVLLDFTGVSRRHAKITVNGCRSVLEDVGSKNGTWRNEVRVVEAIDLHDGDCVRIGITKLTFRSRPQSTTTTTANKV